MLSLECVAQEDECLLLLAHCVSRFMIAFAILHASSVNTEHSSCKNRTQVGPVATAARVYSNA